MSNSYTYDLFSVKETRSYYIVEMESFDNDPPRVSIRKEIVDSIVTVEEPEMIAIICATVEMIRKLNRKFNKHGDIIIINRIEFQECLRKELTKKSAWVVLDEILEMKYEEIKTAYGVGT